MPAETYSLHLVQDETDEDRWDVSLDGRPVGFVTGFDQDGPEDGHEARQRAWGYETACGQPSSGCAPFPTRTAAAWALVAAVAH